MAAVSTLFSQMLSQAVLATGEQAFPEKFYSLVNHILSVDQCTAVVFDKVVGLKTLFTYGAIPQCQAQKNATDYEKGQYLEDPVFSHLLSTTGNEPVKAVSFQINEVNDPNYIKRFYSQQHIVDKISTISCLDRLRIMICLYRIEPHTSFSQQEWRDLTSHLPLINALVINYLKLTYSTDLAHCETAINSIVAGSMGVLGGLSSRERDVCECIIMGRTENEIAELLNISVSSVITYRRRAYNKLSVSSYKELFALVLNNSR